MTIANIVHEMEVKGVNSKSDSVTSLNCQNLHSSVLQRPEKFVVTRWLFTFCPMCRFLPCYFQVHLLGQTMSYGHPAAAKEAGKRFSAEHIAALNQIRILMQNGKRENGYW